MLLDLWQHFSNVFLLLNESILFKVGLLLIIGVIGGNIAEKLKLPRVTGYILFGMMFGPSMFDIIDKNFLYEIKIIKSLTLGFIGFNIGMELNKHILKFQAKKVIFITLFQALVTFVLVFTIVYLFVKEHKLTYALILGSIATVTTPTPIIACMRSYKTSGTISSLVCPIVALDDMVGIFLFSLALPFSIYLSGHEGEIISLANLLLGPVLNIGFSIAIGSIIGIIVLKILKHYKNADNISIVILIFVTIIISVSIGEVYNTSDILLPLTIGVVLANGLDFDYRHNLKTNTDAIVLPLLLVFFTVSGADLNIDSFSLIGGLGLIYIVVRVIGKVVGTAISAKITKQNKNVQKYLGFLLIPQGGVALDMAIIAELRFLQVATSSGQEYYGTIGTTIFTVILSAIVIYKIIGEIIVKWVFKQSGEIDQKAHSNPHII